MGEQLPDATRARGGALTRREGLALLALLALAAAIRVISWVRTAVVFDDGPLFIYIAEAMRDGHWLSVLQHSYHPLYSMTIWWGGATGLDLETVASGLSVAFGVLGVGLLYGFLRDTFEPRVAWLGAALLAIHPRAVTFTSDVQSDGLYMALFVAAMWAVWRSLVHRRLRTAVLAGLLVGLAYLTRPEGLGLALIAGLVAVRLCFRGSWELRRGIAFGAMLGLGFVVVAFPYLIGLKEATGGWQLTQKKSISEMVLLLNPDAKIDRQGGPGRRVPWAEPVLPGPSPPRVADPRQTVKGPMRFLAAVHITAAGIASALRYDVLLLVVLGVWACRGRPGMRGLFLGSIFALYGAVLFALAVNADYVSRRHGLVLMLPLLGYAGIGLETLGRGILLLWRRVSGRGSMQPSQPLGAALAFILVAIFWIPQSVEPRRADRRAMRQAAEWLGAHDPDPGVVAARRVRIAYYAGGRYVPLPQRLERGLTRYLDRTRAGYVIIDESKEGPRFGSAKARPKRLELIHRSSAEGATAAVFRVRPRD